MHRLKFPRWLEPVVQRLPLRGRLAKGGMWLLSGFVLDRGSQFLMQLLLARLLAPSDFGLWAMVLVLTNFSRHFRDGAIASVLVQRGLEDKHLVNAVYSLGVNISVVLFLVQSLAGYPLSLFFNEPILWPLTALHAAVFLINAGTGSHDAVLLQQQRFKQIAMSDTAAGLARLLGASVCGLLGAGPWAFAAAEVSYACADALTRRRLSGYRFTYSFWPDPQAIREVRRFIAGILGISMAAQMNTSGDNMVIGRLLGAQALGYYNVAYQLAMVPVFAAAKTNRVHFSELSKLDPEARQTYVVGALEKYGLIVAPINALSFVIAPWLIPFLYGSEWNAAVAIFQTVLGFAYVRGIMQILGTSLTAAGKPDINARINWALVPVTIPAYLVGAWLGGIQGVAIAVAIVMGIGAAGWFWLAVCRTSGWPLRALARPILLPPAAAAAAVGATLLVTLPIAAEAAMVLVVYLAFAASLLAQLPGRRSKKLSVPRGTLVEPISSASKQ
ncbi:oligosaccharide flippase family protein [Gloeobacter morelensis MG652769]|uniref:Oligosaccharide flippase family protein n=1 Tax=Gloeobacter morelensis MG652769 TaxID=2781736 RepID=A0ABY3PP08_9CYAN|nr:oligosaccharide flippase family protein [Gloeobacter morelensis MG652769]